MTDKPHTPPECDHHWISYMQPSIGLSWIRQCSQCRDFDADDLQEQIAAAEQRGAVKALRDAAESPDLIGHMYREYDDHPLRFTLAPAAVRATSNYLHNRADRIEGTTSDDND